MTPHEIKNSDDLLNFLAAQAEKDGKQWFGYFQQRMTGVALAHQIAARHADKLTPAQVVDYVKQLNNEIFHRIIKPGA
jgi:two-component sensor histidine kinase